MKLKSLQYNTSLSLGCDPEFFFSTKDGTIVGFEKVIPNEGLPVGESLYGFAGLNDDDDGIGKFIVDGVQSELNLTESGNCRALLGNDISECFCKLRNFLRTKKLRVDFSPLVKVTKKEMDSLSEKSKQFGCAPSKNIYFGRNRIDVDPTKYLYRSAGGHIHMGSNENTKNFKALQNVKVMVPMLDIIVGNTCVLIDRDPLNIERRKVYGKVGEYRLKSYGLEYRTLSNFWLRAYPLMSFVMGLSRFTVHLVAQSKKGNDYVKEFMNAVKIKDIITAVQENNFDLAYENFRKIESLIVETAGDYCYEYPLYENNMKNFHHFIMRGIDYWFKENPLTHWSKLSDGHDRGWESFLEDNVRNDRENFEYGKEKYNLSHLKKNFDGKPFLLNEMSLPLQKKKRVVVEVRDLQPA